MDDKVAFAYTAAELGPMPGAGRIRYAQPKPGLMPSERFIVGSLGTKGDYPVSPACALFRTEDIRRNFVKELPADPRVDLTPTGAGTDLLFYLLTASQRPTVAHIAEPLAFFRVHAGSISTDGRDGQVSRSYTATKLWFARTHDRQDLIPTIIAWHWLSDIRRGRWPGGPLAVARRNGANARVISVAAAAAAIAARHAGRRLARVRREAPGWVRGAREPDGPSA